MANVISNTAVAERHELRKQVEKLQPVGRMYFETYRHVRVDDKTVKLVKRKEV